MSETEQAAGAVFDNATSLTVVLKREKITVEVRYPTDAEVIVRHRAIHTFIVTLGGGATRTEVKGVEEADQALYEQIKADGSQDLEPELAALVMQKALKAEAGEATREGDKYCIPLEVPGVMTKHVLRSPSERELRKFRRAAYAFNDLRHRKQELKSNPEVIGDFYDSLHASHEGYAGEVPIMHKLAVIAELFATMDSEESEPDPANF